MNICFLIDNISRSGGSERVTCIIANELAKRGYNITILSIFGNNQCFYKINKKVKIETLFLNKNINHKLHFFSIINKIYKYYKKNDIQLSIEVFASLSIFTIPLKKKLGFKNITWEQSNYYGNIGMNKYTRKLACKYSDAIITLTKEDKDIYVKHERINGYIRAIYNPSIFKENNNYNNNTKNIIAVGRLSYEKGFDMLIDIWNNIEKSNMNWKLNIYGTGDEFNSLNNKITKLKLKNIKLCGATKNIIKCYQKSSLMVMTSRFEGLPMVLIEGQSQKLPIIAFNCKTGPSEIIKNDINGYLINDYNIQDFSEKLLELMINEKKRMEFSNNCDVSKFDVDRIMNDWISIINTLYKS